MTTHPQNLPWPTGTPPAHRIAETLGITRRTVERWKHTGIPHEHTDDFACRILNAHPETIWPGWTDLTPTTFDLFDYLDDTTFA